MKTVTVIWLTLFLALSPVFIGCDQGTKQTPVSVDDNTGDEQIAQNADRYEAWIAQMDPYVSEQKDGTYVLQWDEFCAAVRSDNPQLYEEITQGNPSGNADAAVILELRDGVPVANETILAIRSGASAASEQACWNYWWGRRCCIWGNTARYFASSLSAFSTVFRYLPWISSFIIAAYFSTVVAYTNIYGGFCVNGSWIGGFWITHP